MVFKNIAVIALIAAGGTAAAFAESTEVRKTLEAINACSAETDATRRLACYDATGPRVRTALDLATEEDQFSLFGLFDSDGFSATGEATRPEDFGNRVPQQGVEVAESGGVITEITAPLVDVAKNGAGKEVYILENGQVWRAKEVQSLRLPSDVTGVRVKIRQGVMGSYYLAREGNNKSVAVERVK